MERSFWGLLKIFTNLKINFFFPATPQNFFLTPTLPHYFLTKLIIDQVRPRGLRPQRVWPRHPDLSSGKEEFRFRFETH